MIISDNSKYSLVIAPPKIGIEYVDELKDELHAKIGWYNSRNSKAHVTIVEFTANEDELDEIITHIKEIACYEKRMHLSFDSVGYYSNGAVFLKPDVATKTPLTELMVRVQKNINIKNSYISKDPHISIGRQLNEQNVKTALEMFTNVKLDFDCSNLILRKFNTSKKQYDYFSEDFPFLALPPKADAQQSLF